MKILKKVLGIIGCIILIILVIVVIRSLIIPSRQVEVVDTSLDINLDMDKASRNLSKALQFKTISYTNPEEFDYAEFSGLRQFIDETYPNVKTNLKKETVNQNSLLYTWEGENSELKPMILCAHMDVVGVEEATLGEWKYQPFSGAIAEGKIWGRGARDNKCQVFSILEAVEYLIAKRYKPERTIYLAFGHDEEVLGVNGAAKIGELLEKRGIIAECLIDEGGAIVEKSIPGVSGKVALIGTAEKGYLTLKISTSMEGGHSANPAKETAIGAISEAVSKVEKYQFDGTLDYVRPMFEYSAAEASFPMKTVYSNLWLTNGILKNIMVSSSDTDASIRTTKVATVFNAGFKDNVIPQEASALINLRLMPGDTIQGTIKTISDIINNNKIKIETVGYYNEAPEQTSTDTDSFRTIQKSLKQVFPDSICVPYFVTGGTDAKHYTNITKNLYNMTPSIKEKDEEGHGINERIPIDNYEEYIKVFIQLIKNM